VGGIHIENQRAIGLDASPQDANDSIDVLSGTPYQRHSFGAFEHFDELALKLSFGGETPFGVQSSNGCALHQQHIDVLRRQMQKLLKK
jgi:hypothetical protein